MAARWLRMSFALAFVVPAVGCTGAIAPGPADPTDDPAVPNAGGFGGSMIVAGPAAGMGGQAATPVDPPLAADAPAPAPLLRLSWTQLANALRDLLGDDVARGLTFERDPVGDSGYEEPRVFSPLEYQKWHEAVETIGERAAPKLTTLVPCDVAARGEPTCAHTFLQTLGRRAFRRPVTTDEATQLAGLYTRARSNLALDHAGGLRVLLQAMLTSPRFVFHWERGEAPASARNGAVALDAFEVASRLARMAWSSIPDEPLLQAAESGALDVAGITTQMRRLLADPRADAAMAAFVTQWLHLQGIDEINLDPTAYPAWKPGTRTAMVEELRRFVTEILRQHGGSLEALLTADFTVANGDLADVYGIPSLTGTSWRRVTPPATQQRSGLLTLPAVMTAQFGAGDTWPIYRGLLVREHFLCQKMPPPPSDAAMVEFPNLPANPTARDLSDARKGMASCAGCHRLMDDIGFALPFDAIGRSNVADGTPTFGVVSQLDDGEQRRVENPRQLGELLARQRTVQSCMAEQVARYGLRRKLTEGDARSSAAASDAFAAAKLDVRELFVTLATTYSFRHRAVATNEVLP